MRLTNGLASLLKKLLFISLGCILIVTYLQIVFIGKNLTFTTRFTPLQSQQNNLRNQTYITEAQALIIFICILYVSILPITTYSCIKHQKKAFIPILFVTIGIDALLVFLNIYFLTGASAYRNYMSQHYQEVTESGVCQSGNTTLCMVGTCSRMQVFNQGRSMSIAFTVINIVFSLVFTMGSIMVNRKRKDAQKMELIV